MARSVRPLRFVVAALVVAFVALGLSGCDGGASPRIGTATAGNAQAVVSWQAPPSPASITAYVVTPWIGFARQTPVVFNSPATTQTVTGLTNGVTYTFTVHAVAANGNESAESKMSNPVSLTPSPGLYGWGDNHHGQVGDGWVPERVAPAQVGTAADWASMAA